MAGAVILASKSVSAAIVHTDLGEGVEINLISNTFAIDFGANGITNYLLKVHTTSFSTYLISVICNTASALVKQNENDQVCALDKNQDINTTTNTSYQWQYVHGTLASSVQNSTTSTSGGLFLNTTNKHIAVKFVIGDSSNLHGWIQVDVAGGASNAVIKGYAYNDEEDGQIFAGQMPEAGSLALLALGAVGLAAWRKNRV